MSISLVMCKRRRKITEVRITRVIKSYLYTMYHGKYDVSFKRGIDMGIIVCHIIGAFLHTHFHFYVPLEL